MMQIKDSTGTTWESLILKAQKGNQASITELYNRTYSQGFSVALQMVKNEEDAMDILQNAYISAFKNLHTIREPEKFKNWFNCIVANKCRDFLRKHKEIVFSELEVEEDVSYEETLESDLIEFSPEQSVDYSETKKLINDILQALPQEQKLCILMYYYNELSIKEIAGALECSENTVKSRLNYARNKIKQEVNALEKKGTKLYNAAPIPFIVWMLRGSESTGDGVLSRTMITHVSTELKKKVVRNFIGKSVMKKIVAGVAVVTVAGGATAGVISLKQDEGKLSQEKAIPEEKEFPKIYLTKENLKDEDLKMIQDMTMEYVTHYLLKNDEYKVTDDTVECTEIFLLEKRLDKEGEGGDWGHLEYTENKVLALGNYLDQKSGEKVYWLKIWNNVYKENCDIGTESKYVNVILDDEYKKQWIYTTFEEYYEIFRIFPSKSERRYAVIEDLTDKELNGFQEFVFEEVKKKFKRR